MKISIVVPAHNEADVIANTIRSIEKQVDLDYEIIVVNDYSTDNTVSIIKGLMEKYSNLKLINNDAGRGFANALKKGLDTSDSELIIPIMADLCDDPRSIKDMYDKSMAGFDIVVGSRYTKGGKKIGGPLLQSFFSRLVGSSLKYLIGIPTFDVSNSFKCYRRNILNNLEIKSKSFEISMEITLKAYFSGATIAEVPTIWRGRFIGKSKFYLFKVAPKYIKLYLWAIFKKRWI